MVLYLIFPNINQKEPFPNWCTQILLLRYKINKL